MSLDLLVFVFCFASGLMLILSVKVWNRLTRIRQVQKVAENLKAESLKNNQAKIELQKQNLKDHEKTARKRTEKDFKKQETKLKSVDQKIQKKEGRLNTQRKDKEEQLKTKIKSIDGFSDKVKSIEKRLLLRKDVEKAMNEDFLNRLLKQLGVTKDETLDTLKKEIIHRNEISAGKRVQEAEDEARNESERDAKRILDMALSRFKRAYCPERGLGYVSLANAKQRERFLGKEDQNLELFEKVCGIDVVYDKNNQSLSFTGFDPVRRELARLTAEKLLNERQIDEKRIHSLHESTKVRLFKKIRSDGTKIGKELQLEGLHLEIIKMMGALRYRYSFSQNQHFHCGEVGFLCGLLASELNLKTTDGRRAGLLHDIGKAMDHSTDGGHAVLGADFIEKNGEKEEVVHAVRAHHHDVQPSTPLAFLVIAADALSGARPGARRSTATSYVEKMEGLHVIAKGFKGVTDAQVLSAGREVRVKVNGKNFDDLKTLRLSKKIADKIEDECRYPGTVKVTVVRRSEAVAYAK